MKSPPKKQKFPARKETRNLKQHMDQKPKGYSGTRKKKKVVSKEKGSTPQFMLFWPTRAFQVYSRVRGAVLFDFQGKHMSPPTENRYEPIHSRTESASFDVKNTRTSRRFLPEKKLEINTEKFKSSKAVAGKSLRSAIFIIANNKVLSNQGSFIYIFKFSSFFYDFVFLKFLTIPSINYKFADKLK